eukprot:Lithocolla_globosa_v1_NODE_668_length_3475_cov_31.413743.p1 type:complete len:905 gc:universal NODE_668_length_3475_cov_31.413743:3234-520(-)
MDLARARFLVAKVHVWVITWHLLLTVEHLVVTSISPLVYRFEKSALDTIAITQMIFHTGAFVLLLAENCVRLSVFGWRKHLKFTTFRIEFALRVLGFLAGIFLLIFHEQLVSKYNQNDISRDTVFGTFLFQMGMLIVLCFLKVNNHAIERQILSRYELHLDVRLVKAELKNFGLQPFQLDEAEHLVEVCDADKSATFEKNEFEELVQVLSSFLQSHSIPDRDTHLKTLQNLWERDSIERSSEKRSQLIKKAKIYSTFDVFCSSWTYFRMFPLETFFMIFLTCCSAASAPLSSYYTGQLIDAFSPKDSNLLRSSLFALIFIYIINSLIRVISGYLTSFWVGKVSRQIRHLVTLRIALIPQGLELPFSDSELVSRYTTDIVKIQLFLSVSIASIYFPLISISVTLGFLVALDWKGVLILIFYMPVILLASPSEYAAQQNKNFSIFDSHLTGEVLNLISTRQISQIFACQSLVLNNLRSELKPYSKRVRSQQFWAFLVSELLQSWGYLFVIVQTVILAILTFHDDISQGDFVTLTKLYVDFLTPLATFSMFYKRILSNSNSFKRIDELLGIDPRVSWRRPKKETESKKENSTFSNSFSPHPPHHQIQVKEETTVFFNKEFLLLSEIVFCYEKEKTILKNLNCKIPMNRYVCLVGGSGCGKTTILKLLLRLYRPLKGSISLDDTDISLFGIEDYLSQVSFVPQEPVIFNGTIFDNVLAGKLNATLQDVELACKKAGLSDVIENLPQGYHTRLGSTTHGQTHVSLSGGQKQRLCIARALVRKPKLMLLDEATSALDQMVESEVVKMLEKLVEEEGISIISVTHRLQTTKHSYVMVFEQGKLAEEGLYSDLLERKGCFTDLVNATLDEKEKEEMMQVSKKEKIEKEKKREREKKKRKREKKKHLEVAGGR